MRLKFIILLAFGFFSTIYSQSTAYVFKGGLSLATQKWDDNFDRQVLAKPFGAIAIETLDNDEDRSSLFMQLGYHTRGSATRFRFLFQGGGAQTFSQEFKFTNISLLLGAKMKKPMGENARLFYFGGLRGDYTWKTNIDELSQPGSFTYIYYPFIGGVQRWIGGLSVGGGIEFPFSELIGGQLELTISPDLTPQYRQQAVPNVIDPFNPGNTITIPERRIKNTTIEISLGLRLLKKVIYED